MHVLPEATLVGYIEKKSLYVATLVPNLEALTSYNPSISESNTVHRACSMPTAGD